MSAAVVDEGDDEVWVDDRHRLIADDRNSEVREALHPGPDCGGQNGLELRQGQSRGLFHSADDAAQPRMEADGDRHRFIGVEDERRDAHTIGGEAVAALGSACAVDRVADIAQRADIVPDGPRTHFQTICQFGSRPGSGDHQQ